MYMCWETILFHLFSKYTNKNEISKYFQSRTNKCTSLIHPQNKEERTIFYIVDFLGFDLLLEV